MGAQYAWSRNEERYHGEFDTREEALAEGAQDAYDDGAEIGSEVVITTGVSIPASMFLRDAEDHLADCVAERAEEFLCDNIGWDDTIMELSKEATADLGKLIVDFLIENATFNAWGVGEVQEHRVVVTVPHG
jgi:hypothetical protein